MLTRMGTRAKAWAANGEPWTNVYGLARTLLALGMLGTLLLTPLEVLFTPTVGVHVVPQCSGAAVWSLFCLVPREHLQVGRWIAVAVLAAAASGWRPRVTAPLHWWIAFSYNVTVVLADGGDQVTAVLALILLPVALTDPRRWHWGAPPTRGALTRGAFAARLVAMSALLMARVQVAGIYFHAAVAKLRVIEWADGTAVYYWFTEPAFGMPPWLRPLMMPVLLSPLGVVLLTWGTLVLETFLFTGLVMEKRHRRLLLPLGICFHAGIALVHGLVSFVLAMWAALFLLLRPSEQEIAWLPRSLASLRAALAIRPATRPRLAAAVARAEPASPQPG